MRAAFWVSTAIVLYVYVGYPALLEVWARVRPRERAVTGTAAPAPTVSIVIAARNEGSRIGRRIDNLLELDYPASGRQIIVVSDGSTDDTAVRLAAYGSQVEGIWVEHGGKARALNAGISLARNDILVFTDARQRFARDALVELTRPFADPSVGAVTGELVLDCEAAERRVADRRGRATPWPSALERRTDADRRRAVGSTMADGIGLYWRYEKHLRHRESAVGSTLGATGAIYALRRSLWKPLPPETLLDDVLAPMRAVIAGFRVVFNERARAFDRASRDADAEVRRKIRTLAGNYQILWLEPRLLLPWKNPVWLQYVSHKVGRLLVPYALLTTLTSSMALAQQSTAYAAALAVQCAFYLLAGYGACLEARSGYVAHLARRRPAVAGAHPDGRETVQGAVNG